MSDAWFALLGCVIWAGWSGFCFLAGAAWMYRREWLRAREERGTP
jgi:hypothetical protein